MIINNWIIYTLLYSIINGLFQCAKKKSVQKNNIFEVLTFFTTMSWIISACMIKESIAIDFIYLKDIFLKSFIIVIAWLLDLYAMKRINISLYSILKLSGIIFSVIFSVVILGEILTVKTVIGLLIVVFGLVLVNVITKDQGTKKINKKAIIAVLVSCMLNAMSAIIDKKLLGYINNSQLQFWFLGFLTVLYWGIFVVKKQKLNFKSLKNNYWILISAICLVIGDKFLFIANEIKESEVVIMTIIKQFATIEVIVLSKVLFKEKEILKKILCSILIIIGIVVTIS